MNEHGSLQSHFLESDTPFSGETSATRSTLSNGALSAYEPMNIQNFLTNFRGGDKGVFNQNHLSNTEVFPGNGRCTLPQNAASSKSLSGGVVLSNAVPSNIPPPPEEPSEEVAAPVIALNEEVLYHSFMSVNSMSLPLQNQNRPSRVSFATENTFSPRPSGASADTSAIPSAPQGSRSIFSADGKRRSTATNTTNGSASADRDAVEFIVVEELQSRRTIEEEYLRDMGSLRAAEVSEMLRLQRDYRREHSKRLSLQQRTAELEQEEELLMEKEFRMRLKSLELQQQKEMNQLQQVFEAFENSANNSL